MSKKRSNTCPECTKRGLSKRLRLFQIGWEEAVELCENDECLYPIVTSTSVDLVVKRSIDVLGTKREKLKRVMVDSVDSTSKSAKHEEVPLNPPCDDVSGCVTENGLNCDWSNTSKASRQNAQKVNPFQWAIPSTNKDIDPVSADFDFLLNGIKSPLPDCEVNSELTNLISKLNNCASSNHPEGFSQILNEEANSNAAHCVLQFSEMECNVEGTHTLNNLNYGQNELDMTLPTKYILPEIRRVLNNDNACLLANVAGSSSTSSLTMETVHNTDLAGIVPGRPSLTSIDNLQSDVGSPCAVVDLVKDSIHEHVSKDNVYDSQATFSRDTIKTCSVICKAMINSSSSGSDSNVQELQNFDTTVSCTLPAIQPKYLPITSQINLLSEVPNFLKAENVNSSAKGPTRQLMLGNGATLCNVNNFLQSKKITEWKQSASAPQIINSSVTTVSQSPKDSRTRRQAKTAIKDNLNPGTGGGKPDSQHRKPKKESSPKSQQISQNQKPVSANESNWKEQQPVTKLKNNMRSLLDIVTATQRTCNKSRTCLTKTSLAKTEKVILPEMSTVQKKAENAPNLHTQRLNILSCLDETPLTNSKPQKSWSCKKGELSSQDRSQELSKINSLHSNVSNWLGNKLGKKAQKKQFPGYKVIQKKDSGFVSEDSGIQSPCSSKSDESVESRVIRCQ